MKRSYPNSEQRAIQVLMLLMQERIIPFEPWKAIKATPVKTFKRRLIGIVTGERNFFFDSLYYRIKMKLGTDWAEDKPSEAKCWYFKEVEIKTRPFTFYPWRTQKMNLDQFSEMRSYRYSFNDWKIEAENHYKVMVGTPTQIIELKD